MNTINELKARPTMISIKNSPIFLTNYVSMPEVFDSPIRRNDYLRNELDQKRKLQKSNETILDKLRETNINELKVKLAIMSLINKPACLTTNNDYVTEISDTSNKRKKNSEYEIDRIRTDQNKNSAKDSNLLESLRKSISLGKVIQDNPRPANTNERLISATTSTSICTCSVYKLVSNTRKENLKNELDQKRKHWNSDRRVMQDKPRQTNKDKPRAQLATMSIKQVAACSTINNVSEPMVDSITNVEKSAMERIRKLQHRLDFPNELRENLAQMPMKNASPCSIKKYVSLPDVSKPNWRMKYLERDTLRIVKNDVMCVNHVNQFLKKLFQ